MQTTMLPPDDGARDIAPPVSIGEPGLVGRRRQPLWRMWLPLVGSVGLIVWLVWRVSPLELWRAMQDLNWPLVVVLTGLLVSGLCLWDSLCLKWLFSDPEERLSYKSALRARGTSYLFAIINYSFGQTLLAWLLAAARGITFLAAVGRCALIAIADLCVLLSVGLLGSLLSQDSRTTGITGFCLVGLTMLVALAAVIRLLPRGWLIRLRLSRWGKWLDGPRWQWSAFAQLCSFRFGHLSIGMLYLAAALPLSGLKVDWIVVVSVLPMVALIEGLPISVAGIGTREAALMFFLQPEEPASLLAFCLVWSASVVGGRALIGLVNLWHPATRELLKTASSNIRGRGAIGQNDREA